ncbi:amidohydrolase family protein [Solimonas sp. SE-A11]|uniref:N-acyl-D-amino-acid deacylase family protein n=1 Tax=Solimonas sp. SE-A11 TaxID=3054954 RepID=UPI00259C81F9|nr:amidohydrolase family protein [Solimonas sp. SE-A11]MDM4772049.1 amidohydrolase family protein [Solimonas sp. SE-A11]
MDGGGMRWDVLFRNALVFDGSGAKPQLQDVAVRDGSIAAIGSGLPEQQAAETVDVAGRWLMPGLLDIHTHFDLEVELEPGLPEAVRHGTTTVVVANCSLGLAYGALRRDGTDPIVDCFARVENVPKHVLRKVGDRVNWNDSKAYLDHFSDLPLAPNIVPMIPHSMLRIEVMGLQDSISREPTANELARMGELVEKALREGYVGFSTDALPFHFLANQPNTQKQIPTQFARYGELKFLTNLVRRWGRVWQATPPKDSKIGVFRNFLLTSGRLFGRPLKVTAVAAIDIVTNKSLLRMGLLLSRMLNSRFLNGHFRFQALAAPFKLWSDGVITPIAEEIPVLRRLNERDLDDREGRLQIMSDPAWQQEFRRMWTHGKTGFSLARLKRRLRMDDNVLTRELADMHIETCPVPEWSGESLQQVYERLQRWQASGEGARSEAERETFASFPKPAGDDCDFLLHLLRRFDTALRWWTVTANRDRETTKALLFNPKLLPGFNDSGAHLTNMAFYDGNLRMLQFAQEDGLEKVAYAVHRLTQEPAEFFGLNVGTLKPGAQADIVVMDPEALRAYDSDAGVRYIWRDIFQANQLVNRSDGVVSHVMIAGRMAWRDGTYTELHGRQRLGRVLLDREHEAQAAAVTA